MRCHATARSPSRPSCPSRWRRWRSRAAANESVEQVLSAGPFQLVCWDLDGTLTDSVRFVVDTANLVITRRGGLPLDFDVVGRMTGLPLEDIFRLAWPELTAEDAAACRSEYRAIYDETVIPATRLFDGARELLRELHAAGLLQATVTGKRAADCERILRGLDIEDDIDLYLGGDSVPADRHKPAPDLVLLAMDRLSVPAARTAVVGDTRTDMRMGRAAGARTIQVLWGYERTPVPEADLVVATWRELRARILTG
ncbi:MAG TPA: HAD family hydrolase [Patescibacteria group bacterium]|nr:HAD family hydrolase [Patescibacteria group bacterium]